MKTEEEFDHRAFMHAYRAEKAESFWKNSPRLKGLAESYLRNFNDSDFRERWAFCESVRHGLNLAEVEMHLMKSILYLKSVCPDTHQNSTLMAHLRSAFESLTGCSSESISHTPQEIPKYEVLGVGFVPYLEPQSEEGKAE